MFVRERTARWIIFYGVYLYLSGLSLRRVSAALEPFAERCWTAVWLWVRGLGSAVEVLFNPRAAEAFVDETQVWVHGEAWWLWVAYDIHGKAVLRLEIKAIRCGLTAYWFLKRLRLENGVRTVYTDGGSWYPWAASQARLRHVVISLEECNPWQRVIETIKDRLKAFNIHFPCRCREKRHIKNFLSLYKAYYNHARHHTALGGPPTPMEGETEWLRFKNLIREAMHHTLN